MQIFNTNYLQILPSNANIKNIIRFATTILAPVGADQTNEVIKPIKKHITDKTEDEIVTLKKLLNTRIDVNTGKIIRLEIIIAPIKRIPTTIVKAVSIANIRLYFADEIPLAVANVSSNVTANIR